MPRERYYLCSMTDGLRAKEALRSLHRAAPWLLGLWALAVALATLTPQQTTLSAAVRNSMCVVCGDRGAADAVLNVLLFVPLGTLLAARGWRGSAVILAGICVALGIELTQLFVVPGRHSTAGDVVWNGLGGAAGVAGWLALRWRLSTDGPIPTWVAPAVATIAGVLVLAGGHGLEPSPTSATYYGQRSPRLGHLADYEGQIVQASMNGVPIASGPLPEIADGSGYFIDDWIVRVTVEVGPPPGSLASVLSVYDANRREIFLLGADGHDLVLRERQLGRAAKFEQLELRVPDALAGLRVGQEVALEVRRVGDDRCVAVQGAESCGLGWSPGGTWRWLLRAAGPDSPSARAADAVVVALTMAVIVALASTLASLMISAALLGSLTAGAVGWTRLEPLPPELLGILLLALTLRAAVLWREARARSRPRS